MFCVCIIAPLDRFVNTVMRKKMKKSIALLCLVILSIIFSGCDIDTDIAYSEIESDISVIPDISSNISEPESSIVIDEIYEFLTSPYYVTATRESFGTVYVYEYYFVDGYVAGARTCTTFSDEQTAEDFFEMVSEDNPYASLDLLTVTDFLSDEELNYFGYDLDKLKFMLEKSGYDYEVSFDESVFNNDFYSSKAE